MILRFKFDQINKFSRSSAFLYISAI